MVAQAVTLEPVENTRRVEQIEITERERRIHLFTHSRIEGERQAFSGIGKQDLSALSSSSGQSGQKEAYATEEQEEVLSIVGRDGTRIELPRLSAERRARIQEILQGLDESKRTELLKVLTAFGKVVNEHVAHNTGEPAPNSLVARHAAFVSDETIFLDENQKRTDAQEDTILLGMHGVEQDLVNFFNSLRDKQAVASEVRTDIAELQNLIAEWPDDGSTEIFDYTEIKFNEDRSFSVVDNENAELTKEQAIALLNRLEADEQSLTSMDVLSMQMLQMMVHKYQQALSTASNMIKIMDETHKGIITNVKAG